MPCFFPLQATFTLNSNGKRDIKFSAELAKQFYLGIPVKRDDHMSIPCGYCLGCRLEKSRQWAIRCVHEASMYEKNCFLTLTYAPEHCPKDMSLDKDVMRRFNKRLRKYSGKNGVRFFYCGEYGDRGGRPHYHSLVFNFDFEDKEYWKTVKGVKYYISKSLEKLWGLGFCAIGEVNFNSAAYVARYALKKVYGNKAEDHYKRISPDTGEVYYLQPEFSQPSLKPGIGASWFEMWGATDVVPHDSVVSRGVESKVPRYYDRLWERKDPHGFAIAKEARRIRSSERSDDQTFKRLQSRMKCQEARIKLLIRTMEK